MLSELLKEEKHRILPLIANTVQELSVWSVAFDTLPGEVWVDPENLRCGLIKTPECNLLFGSPAGPQTHTELFTKIGYFDPVTGDSQLWSPVIEEFHPNSAIRKYTRLHYSLREGELRVGPSQEPVQIVHREDLEGLEYENRNIVLDWIHLQNRAEWKALAIAAIVVKDNGIVSCAADCIHENRAEIGIKTVEGHRKLGYGRAAVTALAMALFEQGFYELGWHCVSTNRGSIRIAESVGFSGRREYRAYAPFPPIENVEDLDPAGWMEYAQFFEDRAVRNANHYWQAAQCWAKAGVLSRSIEDIAQLVDRGLLWFKDYLKESPEFHRFNDQEEWLAFLKKIP